MHPRELKCNVDSCVASVHYLKRHAEVRQALLRCTQYYTIIVDPIN